MKTRVQKWGNSLAVRIPQPFAKESKIEENSEVDVSLEKGRLVVVPVDRPQYSLKELVSRITPRNLHAEVETRGAVGNEAW